MENEVFKVFFMEQAEDFLESLQPAAHKKVLSNIRKVRSGVKDSELFKKLGDTKIWEFRTTFGGLAYRLFAFWDHDEETLVIATHGIVKKKQKTPSKEIAKAERLRKEYFEDKKNG